MFFVKLSHIVVQLLTREVRPLIGLNCEIHVSWEENETFFIRVWKTRFKNLEEKPKKNNIG